MTSLGLKKKISPGAGRDFWFFLKMRQIPISLSGGIAQCDRYQLALQAELPKTIIQLTEMTRVLLC